MGVRMAVAVAVVLALAACAAQPERLPDGRLRPPPMAGRPQAVSGGGYGWTGEDFASGPALLDAIDRRVVPNLSVVPSQAGQGSGLRVLLPAPAGADAALAEAGHRLDLARIEAIRVSGLFAPVRVELAGSRPGGGDGGYDATLMRRGDGWMLRDAYGRDIGLEDGADLAAFVTGLAKAAAVLGADGDHGRVLAEAPSGKGVLFHGREYGDFLALNDAFDHYNLQLIRQVRPAAPALGGRALVVVPKTAPGDIRLLPGERLAFLDGARRAYRHALDRRAARLIIASRLFDSVDVDVADLDQPAQGGYDWLIWRRPGQASWLASARGGGALVLDLPLLPVDFAPVVAQALAPAVPPLPSSSPTSPSKQDSPS